MGKEILELEHIRKISLQEINNYLRQQYEIYGYEAIKIARLNKGTLYEIFEEKLPGASLQEIGVFHSRLADILGHEANDLIRQNRSTISRMFGEKLQDSTPKEIGDFFLGIQEINKFFADDIFETHKKILYELIEEKMDLKLLKGIICLLEVVSKISFDEWNLLMQIYLEKLIDIAKEKYKSYSLEEVGHWIYFFLLPSGRVKRKSFLKRQNLSKIFREKLETSPLEQIGAFFSYVSFSFKLGRFAKSLVRNHKNTLFEVFGGKLKGSSLEEIAAFLSGISIASKDVALELARTHSNTLYRVFEGRFQGASIEEVIKFLYAFRNAFQEGATVIAQTHYQSLTRRCEKILQDASVKKIANFLVTLSASSRKLAEELIISHKRVIDVKLRNLSLYDVGYFLYWINRAPFLPSREFAPTQKQRASQIYGERYLVSQQMWFEKVLFINTSNKPRATYISSIFLSNFSKTLFDVFKKKLPIASLEEIESFLDGLQRVSEDVALDFTQTLQKDLVLRFNEQLDEISVRKTSPLEFLNYIERIKSISEDLGQDLIEKNKTILYEEFGENLQYYSPDQILTMLTLMFKSSKNIAIEFLQTHKKIISRRIESKIRDYSLYEIISHLSSIGPISRNLMREIAKMYKGPLTHLFHEKAIRSSLYGIGRFFRDLSFISDSLSKEILKINQASLSEIINEKIHSASLYEIAAFFRNFAKYSPALIEKLVQPKETTIFKVLEDKLRKASLKQINWFLERAGIRQTPFYNFIQEHENIISRIVKEKVDFSFKDVNDFISRMGRDYEYIGEIITRTHQRELTSIIEVDFQTSSLEDIGQFLKYSKSSSNLTEKVLQGRKLLVEKKIRSSSLKEIWKFLERFTGTHRSTAKKFIRIYKDTLFEVFEKKVQESPLRDIGKFLEQLERNSGYNARKLTVIYENTITNVFEEKLPSSSLYNIDVFLRNLSRLSNNFVKKLVHRFEKQILALVENEFQKTEIKEILRFFSSIAVGSEELANKIFISHQGSLEKRLRTHLISRFTPRNAEWTVSFRLSLELRELPKDIYNNLARIYLSVISEVFNERAQEFTLRGVGSFLFLHNYPSALKQKFLQPKIPQLIELFKKNLYNSGLFELGSFFSGLASISEKKAKELIQKYEKQLLNIVNEKFGDATLISINKFISSIAKASESLAIEIIHTHKSDLDEKFRNASLLDILNSSLIMRPLDSIRKIILQSHKKTLIDLGDTLLMRSFKDIVRFRFFIRIAEFSEKFAQEFAQAHQTKLSEILQTNIRVVPLSDTGEFLSGLAKTSEFVANNIVQLHQTLLREVFITRLQEANLHEIGKFLSGTAAASKPIAQELVQSHKNQLVEAFTTNLLDADGSEIGFFFAGVASSSESIAHKILQISLNKLSDMLEEKLWDANLDGIGEFFLGISTTSKNTARELLQTHKSLLSELINNKLPTDPMFYTSLPIVKMFSGIACASEDLLKEIILKSALGKWLVGAPDKEIQRLISQISKISESAAKKLASIFEQLKASDFS